MLLCFDQDRSLALGTAPSGRGSANRSLSRDRRERFQDVINRSETYDAGAATELRDHLRQFAVVPYSEQICITYAEVMHRLDRAGRPIGLADGWIAASALSLDIALITHNCRHFNRIPELQVLSAAMPCPTLGALVSWW